MREADPFQPVGERARWRVIYDLMKAAEIGDLITYEQMAAAIGQGELDRHALQMAARRAGLELERVDMRAVDAVRNAGYRVQQPEAHLGLGLRRNRRAGRQIDRGYLVTTSADLNNVSPDVAKALMTVARGFALQREINARVAERQDKADSMIQALADDVARIKEEVRRNRGSPPQDS